MTQRVHRESIIAAMGKLSMLDRVRTARPTAWLAWLVAAPFAGWAVVRVGGLERGYPASALLAFTPYVTALAVVAAIVAFAMWQRKQALALAVCALALLAVVVPRAIPNGAPDPRPTGPEVQVLGINLMLGRADLGALAETIRDRDIDVVAFSELTPETARTIARSPIADELPYDVTDAFEGSGGTGLRSRFPLRRLDAPGTEGFDLPTTRAEVMLPGGNVAEAFAIHPRPPLNPKDVKQLNAYLEAIPGADPDGAPRLLIGDFNSTLDDERLRAVLDRGYTDAADARGAGLQPTWPTDGFPPPVTIDHVLADERVGILDFATVDISGTDHRGVEAELRLPRWSAAPGGG